MFLLYGDINLFEINLSIKDILDSHGQLDA